MSLRLIIVYLRANYIWCYCRCNLDIDSSAQNGSTPIANALEILKSCTKPWIWCNCSHRGIQSHIIPLAVTQLHIRDPRIMIYKYNCSYHNVYDIWNAFDWIRARFLSLSCLRSVQNVFSRFVRFTQIFFKRVSLALEQSNAGYLLPVK